MTFFINFITFYALALADTLSAAYNDLWQGVGEPEHGNIIMQTMASQGLIFVVLGVSLIIWFVLIAYLIRLEKKLSDLEQKLPE